MADYSEIGSKTLSDVGHALTGEGLGVALGFMGAAFLGRQIQNRLKTDTEVIAAPTITNYAYAWGGNNVPKLAAWYVLRKYDAQTELTADMKKAVAGSVVFDTIMRLFNKGTNPATAAVGGYEILGNGNGTIQGSVSGASSADVQRVLQENNSLRTEVNNLMRKLAEAGIPVSLPTPAVRQKKYAFAGEENLQTPRQKKFAFAGDTGLSDLTAKFGML
jgi:hypothetical protein